MIAKFRELLDAKLNAIATRSGELGYSFERDPNDQRDTEWLFWHMRCGFSYQQIMTKWNNENDLTATATAVAKAIPKIAEWVGVDLIR